MCPKSEWEDTRDHEVPGRRGSDSRPLMPAMTKRLVIYLALAGTLGGFASNSLSWVGMLRTSPQARMADHEKRLDFNHEYTRLSIAQMDDSIQRIRREFEDSLVEVRQTLTWSTRLTETSVASQCLDAEEHPQARRNLARASVPCDLLYRKLGIRP